MRWFPAAFLVNDILIVTVKKVMIPPNWSLSQIGNDKNDNSNDDDDDEF